MSIHSYRPSADTKFLVGMGYDQPLSRLWLTIYKDKENPFEELVVGNIVLNEDDEIVDGPLIIYDCSNDPEISIDHSVSQTALLAYFCRKIMDFSKGTWDIPDQMKLNVLEDAFVCRGNQCTTYEDDL